MLNPDWLGPIPKEIECGAAWFHPPPSMASQVVHELLNDRGIIFAGGVANIAYAANPPSPL